MCQNKIANRDFFHEEEKSNLNRNPTVSDPWEFQYETAAGW